MKINKFFEFLYLLSSLIMAGFLIVVLYYSFMYWNDHFPNGAPIDSVLFYIAIAIAIVTSLAQWIEGRIKAIIISWNIIKGGEEWQRKMMNQLKKKELNPKTNFYQ